MCGHAQLHRLVNVCVSSKIERIADIKIDLSLNLSENLDHDKSATFHRGEDQRLKIFRHQWLLFILIIVDTIENLMLHQHLHAFIVSFIYYFDLSYQDLAQLSQ
jgi:hypothetical protein